jgi:cell division protein FtsB
MKRLITGIICIVCLIFIFNIVKSIVSLWQRGSLVTDQQAILTQKQQENETLKAKLQEAESPEFIERQAREKLNLQKEGEVVVVLPKSQNLNANDQKEIIPVIPNWKQWWKMIIN